MTIWRRRAYREAVAACGHHYHPTERGWRCCGCPHQVRRGKFAAEPPEPGIGVCREARHDESVGLWLAAPRPISRPGRRPGRRNFKRRPRTGAA